MDAIRLLTKKKENKIVIFRLIETFKQNEKKFSNYEDNSYSFNFIIKNKNTISNFWNLDYVL